MKRPSRILSSAFLRFMLCLPVIFLYFVFLTLVLKMIFLGANWSSLKPEGYDTIVWVLWKGLRFDISIMIYLLLPGTLLYYVMAMIRSHKLRWFFIGYIVAIALIIPILWLADLQYFQEAGKHFTYEAFVYLGLAVVPVITGAFKLNPWLSWISLFASIGFAVLTGFILWRLLTFCLPAEKTLHPLCLLTLPVFIALGVIGLRGGLQKYPLNIGNSCISTSPFLNALCLNPIYSVFRTLLSFSTAEQKFMFYNENFNLQTIRNILSCRDSPFHSDRYPLLRVSPGTQLGNRKNVVIFFLESWSAEEIGCLGGKAEVTPFFNSLSREGLLFANFYANGIRTGEGIISMLCSFPNQPVRPIIHMPIIYETHWSSLSQILADTGYYNIFIHGRDLDFDALRDFLRSIHFHKIIDRHDFPPSALPSTDSWPGYNDEDVMRRTDEEFSRQNGHPFLGVIYTMNTHPPFVTPEGFPQPFPPTSVTNRFLNSLKYSDYTLKVFFSLAKKRPYFKNSIFLFVSDHARTGDRFNFSNQHHIPLLIYSPGYVQPGLNAVVGSQIDLLPTVLGLLQLQATHASWGRNLLELPKDQGFAICVAGNEVRWHDSSYVLNDSLSDQPPLLFDITKDPNCTVDLWNQRKSSGELRKTKIRAYISLSQTLLYQNRVYP